MTLLTILIPLPCQVYFHLEIILSFGGSLTPRKIVLKGEKCAVRETRPRPTLREVACTALYRPLKATHV